MIEIGLCL